jgi:hypothetical protein
MYFRNEMILQEITSVKDNRIQLARSLNTLKGRLESGKFLIEGNEAIDWALNSGSLLVCKHAPCL